MEAPALTHPSEDAASLQPCLSACCMRGPGIVPWDPGCAGEGGMNPSPQNQSAGGVRTGPY